MAANAFNINEGPDSQEIKKPESKQEPAVPEAQNQKPTSGSGEAEPVGEHDYIKELLEKGGGTPAGFNSLSPEDKQKYAKVQLENLNKSLQNPPEVKPTLETKPTFDTHFMRSAKAALEVLKNFSLGGEDATSLRDPSFSVLTNEEKLPIYISSFEAIKSLGKDKKLNDWFIDHNKKIVLVGDSGVNFDGNVLRIGPGASPEDIVGVIEEEGIKSGLIKERKTGRNISIQKPEVKTQPETSAVLPAEQTAAQEQKPAAEVQPETAVAKPEEQIEEPAKEQKVAEQPRTRSIKPPTTFEAGPMPTSVPASEPVSVFAEDKGEIAKQPKESAEPQVAEEITAAPSPEPMVEQAVPAQEPTPIVQEMDSKQITEEKQEKLTAGIKEATNFDELYKILQEAGGITGSRGKLYSAEELISDIKFFKEWIDGSDYIDNKLGYYTFLNRITRSNGLRDKVEELSGAKAKIKFSEIIEPAVANVQEQEVSGQPESEAAEPAAAVSPTESIKPTEPEQPKPEPAVSVDQKIEKDYSDWRDSEEWQKFEAMREDLARYENPIARAGMSSIGLELKRSEYRNYKEAVAKKIEESFNKNAGENLAPEQREELNKTIHDSIFDELIKKEDESYRKALQERKDETLTDKSKEALKKAFNTKVGQWYLGLDWKTRLALSTGVITAAASVFGTVAAAGAFTYGAKRFGRGALAFGGSTLARGGTEKIMSEEKIKEEWDGEIEKLKNQTKDENGNNISLEEKSRMISEINDKYEKMMKNAKLTKAGVAVLAGAGTAAFVGLVGNEISTGGVKSSLDSQGSKGGTMSSDVHDHNSVKAVEHLQDIPKVSSSGLESVFPDPETLKHIKIGGGVNSFWGTIGKGLEGNDQYSHFSEGQKERVISYFMNKGISSAGKYGLISDPDFGIKVEAGKEIDLSKLFGDPEEIKRVLNNAAKMTASEQQETINTATQINAYLKDHPGVKLTEDKVSEILNYKPKTEGVSEPTETKVSAKPSDISEDFPKIKEEVKFSPQEHLDNTVDQHIEPIKSPTPETLVSDQASETAADKSVNQIDNPKAKGWNESDADKLHEEIREAKKRLAKIEGQKKVTTEPQNSNQNPNLERAYFPEAKFSQEVEKAFRSEVDSIYGNKGLMGLGKVEGVDTKEWGEMARLPASKIVEYYTGDSAKSGLPVDVIEKLSKSRNHNFMMRQMAGLMEQTNGAVKPFEHENVEQFLKRLGGFVLKNHQPITKAA